MIVRMSFSINVPNDTTAKAIETAAYAVACAAENAIEKSHGDVKGAPAGRVRITIFANQPHTKGPR